MNPIHIRGFRSVLLFALADSDLETLRRELPFKKQQPLEVSGEIFNGLDLQ